LKMFKIGPILAILLISHINSANVDISQNYYFTN